jgi:hypothetical protein
MLAREAIRPKSDASQLAALLLALVCFGAICFFMGATFEIRRAREERVAERIEATKTPPTGGIASDGTCFGSACGGLALGSASFAYALDMNPALLTWTTPSNYSNGDATIVYGVAR